MHFPELACYKIMYVITTTYFIGSIILIVILGQTGSDTIFLII